MTSDSASPVEQSLQSKGPSATMKACVAVAFAGLTLSVLNLHWAYFASALLSIPFIIGFWRLVDRVHARWFDVR